MQQDEVLDVLAPELVGFRPACADFVDEVARRDASGEGCGTAAVPLVRCGVGPVTEDLAWRAPFGSVRQR